jgi:hypothetical protein
MTLLSDEFVPWSDVRLSCKFIDKMINAGIVDQFHPKSSFESALESARL